MPIYEYQCGKCGKAFEVLIRRSADLPEKCPACGAGKLAKLFSSFAVSAPSSAGSGDEVCGTCPSAGGRGTCASGTCPLSHEH